MTGKGLVNGLPMDVDGKGDLPLVDGNRTVNLNSFAARLGRSTLKIQGRSQGALAYGELTVSIPEIAELKPLIHIEARGDLNANIKLAAAAGRQSANGSLTGDALGYGKAVSIGRWQVMASAADIFRKPVISAQMNLKDMLLARQQLASLQAQIDGSIDRMDYQACRRCLARGGSRQPEHRQGDCSNQRSTRSFAAPGYARTAGYGSSR